MTQIKVMLQIGVLALVLTVAKGAAAEITSECVSNSAAASGWKVDSRRTTERVLGYSGSELHGNEVYVRFTRNNAGCWRIDQISKSLLSHTQSTQEILLINSALKYAAVAYEVSGEGSWCFDDTSRNKLGYGPCESWLAPRKTGQKILSTFLTLGTLKYDRWNEIDPGRVRELLASVPSLSVDISAFMQRDAERQERERAAASAKEAEIERRLEEERVARDLRIQKARAEFLESAVRWRATVKLGDGTHCGMVIQRREDLVEVQTSADGNHWFRLSEVFPPGTVSCIFMNGSYVAPRLF